MRFRASAAASDEADRFRAIVETLPQLIWTALPDGRAFALKTDDGAPRVRPVLMAEALRRSGVLGLPGVDAEAVRRTGVVELLGGGPCGVV